MDELEKAIARWQPLDFTRAYRALEGVADCINRGGADIYEDDEVAEVLRLRAPREL